jgi:CD36 family
MEDYTMITNWNGAERLPYWKSESCNAIRVATDGSAFPPDMKPNTKLYVFNPDLCRPLPLVYNDTIVHDGIEGK